MKSEESKAEDSSDDTLSIDPEEFTEKPSSCTFNLEDVEGIIYGGISSRFWMLRKHLCSLNPVDHKKGDKIPFHSWECLTLMLKNRDVDLVIKNEKHMDRFLKFLVYHMNTVDGNKGSAKRIYEKLVA